MKKGRWVVCVVMGYTIVIQAMGGKEADLGDFASASVALGAMPGDEGANQEDDPVRTLVKKAGIVPVESFKDDLAKYLDDGYNINIVKMDNRFGREMTPLDIVNAQLSLVANNMENNKSDAYSQMKYRFVNARTELMAYGAVTNEQLKRPRCGVS